MKIWLKGHGLKRTRMFQTPMNGILFWIASKSAQGHHNKYETGVKAYSSTTVGILNFREIHAMEDYSGVLAATTRTWELFGPRWTKRQTVLSVVSIQNPEYQLTTCSSWTIDACCALGKSSKFQWYDETLAQAGHIVMRYTWSRPACAAGRPKRLSPWSTDERRTRTTQRYKYWHYKYFYLVVLRTRSVFVLVLRRAKNKK